MDRHPKTGSIWNRQDLKPVIEQLLTRTRTVECITVLDVGAGGGRFLTALADKLADRKCQYYGIEPDPERKPKILPTNISTVWLDKTVEKFLTDASPDLKFNVIVFSFVFHAIPSLWCSVLDRLLATHCAEECLILINEVHGNSDIDKEILLAVDLTDGLDVAIKTPLASSILQNQIRRSIEQGVIWNSPVKASDISCVRSFLQASGMQSDDEIDLAPLQVQFAKQHYAWTFGAQLGQEEESSPLPKGKTVTVDLIERWYFYRHTGKKTQYAHLQTGMALSRQKAFDYMAFLRPKEITSKSIAGDALVSQNLPKLLMSTLLNCGLISANSSLRAAFLANSGSSLIRDAIQLDSILLFLRQLDDTDPKSALLSKMWRLHSAAFPLLRIPSFSTEMARSGKTTIVHNASVSVPANLRAAGYDNYSVECPALGEADFDKVATFEIGSQFNYLQWTAISMTYDRIAELPLSETEKLLISKWFTCATPDETFATRTRNLSLLLNATPLLFYFPIRSAWSENPKSSQIEPEHFYLLGLAYERWDQDILDEVERLRNALQVESQRLADLTFYSRWKLLHRSAAQHSARAAIMSRNLSHNVGSHALANSRFFEAVGVLNEQSSAPPEDDEKAPLLLDHFDRNEKGKSPAKPDGYVRKGEVWRARTRLGMLNSYLQGRMDFIARALGESQSHPEPMFFVNDVLRSFLSQTVLLNTLLSDNGYTAPDLEFRLTIRRKADTETPKTYVFQGKPRDGMIRHVDFQEGFLAGNGKLEPGAFSDVLVAIPGGMVGRHAFYAFMENYLRNAAKYGSKSRQKGGTENFCINLLLEERDEKNGAFQVRNHNNKSTCYTLTIWDNISLDEQSAVNSIREHLNKAIIDNQGKPRSEGHGIQEMKVCAQFLAGGDKDALVFPQDTDSSEPLSAHCAGPEYVEYLRTVSKQDAHVDVTEHNSLLCYERQENVNKHLAYALLIQQPRLLGIVDYGSSQAEAIVTTKEPTVVFYKDIQTLADNPADFGLILLRDLAKVEEVLEITGPLHTALPFRLMIVVENEVDLGDVCPNYENEDPSVRARIWRWQHRKAMDWQRSPTDKKGEICSFPLPARRVHAIACPQLFSQMTERDHSEWQQLILRIYDAWLAAYKGCELKQRGAGVKNPKWHLAIGLERDRASVLDNKWNVSKKPGEVDLGFHSSQVALHIYWKKNRGDGTLMASSHRDTIPVRTLTLALDNHGNVIPGGGVPEFWKGDSTPAYHAFSGSEQISLFQLLDSPPQERFSRGFLVFSVAEAMLTRIVVVDERLADATVYWEPKDKPTLFDGDLSKKLLNARIITTYSIHTEYLKKDGARALKRFPLSTTAALAMTNSRTEQNACTLDQEGLHLSPFSHAAINKPLMTANRQIQEMDIIGGGFAPDFLIIHEGVTDHLADEKAWCFNAHQEIFKWCPAIIRTSGRGSTPRHLSEALPFLEFSELSTATYQQLNKIALTKGLMSLRGAPDKGPRE